MKALTQFKHLKHLFLRGTKITDAGLNHLGGMKQLETLDLYRAAISDTGIAILNQLTALTFLDLSHTNIGDGSQRTIGSFE